MNAPMPATALCILLLVADRVMGAPPDEGPVTGTWVYARTEGSVGTEECPDFVSFAPDGRYRVENECAAVDPRDPVVETGTWSLEGADGNSMLVLGSRTFLADQDFLGEGMSPRLRVRAIDTSILSLEICRNAAAGGDCRVDVYRRWTP